MSDRNQQASADATDATGDGPHGTIWNAPFIIIALAYIMARGAGVIFGPAKDDIASKLGVSLTELMTTRTTNALVSASVVIPAAILISRFSPGALAWPGILLYSIGLALLGLSQSLTMYYVGGICASIGSILVIPLFGQIARDHLSLQTFVIASTIVIVLGRVAQAISLMATGLVYDAIGWRSLYIIWAVVMIPIAILAWRFIKPNTTSTQDNSIGLWITRLIWLLKKPLVWICGLSFGLTIATIGNFGFIWNINLQKSLGWGEFNANLLTLVFVIGVIVGGYFVTWLSKHIGEYLAVVINMSIGLGVFIVCVFVTSSLREILVSIPMLFFVGATLGTGTMIQPYIARFFDRDMSAMFFGITTAIYLVIAGIIVSAPMWHLASETNWQASDLRLALIPYFVTIIVGIGIFAMTRLIIKQRINEER